MFSLKGTLRGSRHCEAQRSNRHAHTETAGGQPPGSQGKRGPQEKQANTFILNFKPPELCRKKCVLIKPPRLWYFVMTALAKQYKN